MPPTQNSHSTFKPNLTCIFLSARARYIMSNPDEIPCNWCDSRLRLDDFGHSLLHWICHFGHIRSSCNCRCRCSGCSSSGCCCCFHHFHDRNNPFPNLNQHSCQECQERNRGWGICWAVVNVCMYATTCLELI